MCFGNVDIGNDPEDVHHSAEEDLELPRRRVLRSDRTKGESLLKLVFFDRPRNLRAITVKSVRVQRLCVGSRRKRSTTSLIQEKSG